MGPPLEADYREIRDALRPTIFTLARRCAVYIILGLAVVFFGFPWLLVAVTTPFLA